MFQHVYRKSLSQTESEAIRSLRRRGFAVVLFDPLQVGGPLNRKVVENSMLKAGRRACKESEERQPC